MLYLVLTPPSFHSCAYAGAEPERVIREIEDIIGLDCTDILKVSAKMGLGIEEVRCAVAPQQGAQHSVGALHEVIACEA